MNASVRFLRTLIVIGLLTLVSAAVADITPARDFQPLIGRWQRTDGGYIIEIRRIDSDGKMDAGYFNPNPINVSRSKASIYKDYLKIEVELHDRGYPGSTYILVYVADKDALIGYYYHAASRQNFDVVFVRKR